MQLLNEYSPIAAVFLGVLIPIFEPLGWSDPVPGTLLGYQYSLAAIAAIAISAGLGLLVRFTTTLCVLLPMLCCNAAAWDFGDLVRAFH